MDLKKKTIIKIFSNYCFYTEIRGIIENAPSDMDLSPYLDLNYYDDLFKDVLADVFGHKENDKKARDLGHQLQIKFINTPKQMRLEEYNFLIGLFKSFLIMTKPTKKQKEHLTKNIESLESGRGFFIFKNFTDIQESHYVVKKTKELESLESHLTDLLAKHMGEKYGIGGIMMNSRTGQVKEF